MKATLTFTLPEEAKEHRLALDGAKWQDAVAELDERLRQITKHQSGEPSERAAWARELLHEALREHGLELP